MALAYYYFVASLAMLEFEKPAAYSCSDFLQEAKRQLSAEDYQNLAQAVLGIPAVPSAHPFLAQWHACERQLRSELARWRAKKLGKTLEDSAFPQGYVASDVIERVASLENIRGPLGKERALDAFRWNKIDEFSAGHYFDLEVLMAYALKLQILDRYRVIYSDQGRHLFEQYQQERIFEHIHI